MFHPLVQRITWLSKQVERVTLGEQIEDASSPLVIGNIHEGIRKKYQSSIPSVIKGTTCLLSLSFIVIKLATFAGLPAALLSYDLLLPIAFAAGYFIKASFDEKAYHEAWKQSFDHCIHVEYQFQRAIDTLQAGIRNMVERLNNENSALLLTHIESFEALQQTNYPPAPSKHEKTTKGNSSREALRQRLANLQEEVARLAEQRFDRYLLEEKIALLEQENASLKQTCGSLQQQINRLGMIQQTLRPVLVNA